MRVALELLRDGKVQACVSSGNTGALMALSRHVLKTLPGIDRPAMVAAVPTQTGYCQLLDLGANVDCTAAQLFQFAVMGSVAAQALGILRPRVALLNIGTEDVKGNQQVKEAAALLQAAPGLNYIGFVEGDGVYRGEADVVVCDGFCRQYFAQVQRRPGDNDFEPYTGRLQTHAVQSLYRCAGIAANAAFAG